MNQASTDLTFEDALEQQCESFTNDEVVKLKDELEQLKEKIRTLEGESNEYTYKKNAYPY